MDRKLVPRVATALLEATKKGRRRARKEVDYELKNIEDTVNDIRSALDPNFKGAAGVDFMGRKVDRMLSPQPPKGGNYSLRRSIRRYERLTSIIEHQLVDNARGLANRVREIRELREPTYQDMLFQARDLFTYYGDSIRYRSGSLTQTTERIEIEGIVLGRFEIQLCLRDIASDGHKCFRAIALDPNPSSSNCSVTHPNVQDECICFGTDAGSMVGQALKEGRLLSAFMTTNAILNTGGGDPYVSIEAWDESSEYDTHCEICEGRFDRENEGAYCDYCSHYVCDNHSSYCEGGCDVACCSSCVHDAYFSYVTRDGTTSTRSAGFCDECAGPCDQCGNRWSSQEIKEYPGTSDSLCTLCTNKRSLDDEQRQKEEEESAEEAAAQGYS